MDRHTESECFVYENAYSLGTKLNDLRTSDELCDVILKQKMKQLKLIKLFLVLLVTCLRLCSVEALKSHQIME